MKIFIINGHKYYWYSEGKLNKTMFDEMKVLLSDKNEIKTTVIEKGYDVDKEIRKYLWADVVIFQTPVNWFSVPWLFKKYIDEVYQMGVFYKSSLEYGKGGLFTEKKYMFSLTWSSPEGAFNETNGFFDGRSVDDVYISLHKLHEYCGMKKLETFSLYDVVKKTDIEKYRADLKMHLSKYFDI